MRVLSLFDGISCGMVALQRLGIKVDTYVAYEIDKYAIKVSEKNYPSIIHKGDVFQAEYIENDFDLLLGGSPCTYWSIARARGDNKDRETVASGQGWDLFCQYLRALREVKPKYFLYENNASMSDEIKECISKELGCEPILIDSQDFSAQIRKRYYWTNIPVDMNYEKKNLFIKDIVFDDNYKVCNFNKYENTKVISKDGESVKWDTSGRGNYSQQNRARSKNLKMNTIPSSGLDKNNIWLGGNIFRRIHPVEAERCQTLPDNYTDCVSATQRMKCIGNGWTVDVIMHLLKNLKEEN